jgi:hypothetical protein
MTPSTTRLSPSQQKIINAVAFLCKNGETTGWSAPRGRVKQLSGYSPKNTGFVVALSGLKNKKKCITYDSETITLTEYGVKLAEFDATMQESSNDEYLAKIRGTLKGKKAKLIFDVLKDGKVHTRNEVALEIGYDTHKCSGFTVAISQLSSNKYMEYCTSNNGEPALRLTDLVFPCGRPL